VKKAQYIIFSTACDKYSLQLLIIQQALFNLGIIVSICCFQESVLSTVIRQNFTKSVCIIILLSCSIFILLENLFLVVNCTQYVLLRINERSLELNHMYIILKTIYKLLSKFVRHISLIITLVSSANNVTEGFLLDNAHGIIDGKSLI